MFEIHSTNTEVEEVKYTGFKFHLAAHSYKGENIRHDHLWLKRK